MPEKLKNVIEEDWTFARANTRYMTHGLHPYPARMIPQIARKLIIRYSKPGDVLLDPFMGSGGVLVEATLKLPSELTWRIGARRSYGIDINPLALLLAKAKTKPIDPRLLREETSKLLRKTGDAVDAYRNGHLRVTPPHFRNIDYWFKPKVKDELKIIFDNIEMVEEDDQRDFFKACFSRTIRESSNTRSNEFKLYRIPDDALVEYSPDTLEIFRKNVEKAVKCMEEYYDACELGDWARPKILDEDTREETSAPEKNVNLVVTSPPYGDSRTTVAYGQFSRLSMQWLNLDSGRSGSVDRNSLGGRRSTTLYDNINSPTFSSALTKIAEIDPDRAKDVLSYFRDLKKCFHEISRLMDNNGKVCIVIGNRTVKGLRIPTHRIVTELGKEEDLEHFHTYERRIPIKRIPWENSPSNVKGEKEKTIHREYIIVLSRRRRQRVRKRARR